MSRRRVAYVGGRPVSVDEGPSSAAAHDVVSMHANGGMAGLPLGPTGGAGPVERRKATPEEMAAARARETKPRLIPLAASRPGSAMTNAQRAQASRQRGAERHLEVMAARRVPDHTEPDPAPAIEEETVSEPRADLPETIPEPEVVDLDEALEVLANAAAKARVAWVNKLMAAETALAADAAWETARGGLAYAWGQAGLGPLHAVPAALYDELQAAVGRMEDGGEETPAETAAIDEVEAAMVEPGEVLGRERRFLADAVQPETRRRVARVNGGLTLHEQRVLESVLKHDGARKPVAIELTTSDANVLATLERIGKRGLLPIALIEKLPARFAKYMGTA